MISIITSDEASGADPKLLVLFASKLGSIIYDFSQSHPFFSREKYNENKAAWPTNHTFTFSAATGNSSLRVHLENHHADEYEQLCATKGWRMQLPKKRRDDTEASIGQEATPGAPPRLEYSRQNFLRAIIKFVVADDQVCFNLFKRSCAYLAVSLSMSSNVVNSATSCFSFGKIYKTRISPTALNSEKPSSRHGKVGSRH
jgi:hypothetical protein